MCLVISSWGLFARLFTFKITILINILFPLCFCFKAFTLRFVLNLALEHGVLNKINLDIFLQYAPFVVFFLGDRNPCFFNNKGVWIGSIWCFCIHIHDQFRLTPRGQINISHMTSLLKKGYTNKEYDTIYCHLVVFPWFFGDLNVALFSWKGVKPKCSIKSKKFVKKLVDWKVSDISAERFPTIFVSKCFAEVLIGFQDLFELFIIHSRQRLFTILQAVVWTLVFRRIIVILIETFKDIFAAFINVFVRYTIGGLEFLILMWRQHMTARLLALVITSWGPDRHDSFEGNVSLAESA